MSKKAVMSWGVWGDRVGRAFSALSPMSLRVSPGLTISVTEDVKRH